MTRALNNEREKPRHEITVKIRHRFVAALLGFAFLSFFFAVDAALAAGKTPLKIGDVPPSVSLTGIKGEVVRFPSQYRGKVLIIHFWAIGCSSCRQEMADLESLYKAYSRKGLAILAINVGERKETVEKAVKSLGIPYQVLLDSDKSISQRYDVVGIPRTLLIDRNGIIRYKIVGEANEYFLKKQILSML